MTSTAICALVWCIAFCFSFVTRAILNAPTGVQIALKRSQDDRPGVYATSVLAGVVTFGTMLALVIKAFGG